MKFFLPPDYEISAILPRYTACGDQSVLYTAEKKRLLLPAKTKTVLRRLATRRCVDLCSLRANTARLTKSAQCQPLPISAELLLVPVRARQPRISGDSTLGYLNYHQIGGVCRERESTVILLKNGEKIPVLWKECTVNLYLQRAQIAALTQQQWPQLLWLLQNLLSPLCRDLPSAFP